MSVKQTVQSAAMPLTQDEIDGCRDAFLAYDKDRSGSIEVWELKEVLEGAKRTRYVVAKPAMH